MFDAASRIRSQGRAGGDGGDADADRPSQTTATTMLGKEMKNSR